MVRCPSCKTIQRDGQSNCQACGTALAGGSGPNGPSGHAKSAPGQGGNGQSGNAGRQPANDQAAPGRRTVAGQEGPGAPRAVTTTPPPPRQPTSTAAQTFQIAPLAAPASEDLVSPAPPIASGPVVLGPASDPAVSGRPAHAPDPYVSAASGSSPVVVGPPPEEGSSTTALKVTAVVMGSLVLVTLIALVVVLLRGQDDQVTTGPSTSAPSSSAAPTSAPTTVQQAPASVSISAQRTTVNTGEAITINVSFTGDPNAVETTTLVINTVPSPEPVKGLKSSFTVDAGSVAASSTFKVAILMKDGHQIESQAATVNIVTPTTPTPQTVYVTQTTSPPNTSCMDFCDGPGTTANIRPGHTLMGIRSTPSRSGELVRNVDSGDTTVIGMCTVTGEWAPAVGNAPAGDNWIRLTDGNYFWDSWTYNIWPRC